MSVKTVQVEPGLSPELTELVQKAEPVVEAILGDFADRVTVAWGPGWTDADGEETARLRITDENVTRTEDLPAWVLEDSLALRRRVRGMWDRVLAQRIRDGFQRIFQNLSTVEGE